MSAVEFDETGDYLATGDKGGRIVLFERADAGKGRKRPYLSVWPLDSHSGGASSGNVNTTSTAAGGGGGNAAGSAAAGAGASPNLRGGDDVDMEGSTPGSGIEYRFYTEFQSHEAEFDYLKSVEIEEKINRIAWAKRVNSNLFLLSTNDKTIKLWKVAEKRVKTVTDMNVETGRHGGRVPVSSLRMPTVSTAADKTVLASTRRVYGNAHAYHVNSISANADGAT